MRRLPVVVLGASAILALGGCTSAPDPQSVTLLAGGGDGRLNEVTGEPAAGPESELGRVTALTGRGDGTVWGLVDRSRLLAVDADGTTRLWRVATEQGESVELDDLAVAPDGTVYVLPAATEVDLLHASPVYVLDDDAVMRPVFEEATVTGPVGELAVDAEGRLVFAVGLGEQSADVPFEPHQIRRLEADGSITTLAGADEVPDPRTSDESDTGTPLPTDVPAEDLPLYAAPGLAPGPGADVYLASSQSIVRLTADGALEYVAGGGPDGEGWTTDEVFGEPVDAAEFAYASTDLTIEANDAGDLAAPVEVPDEDVDADDVVSWDVDGGTDATQAIVDAAWETSAPTALVTADGEATMASMLGGHAAWLDDDTLAIAADDGSRSILVTVDVP